MENQRRMTIIFNDGTDLKFCFPKQTGDLSNLSSRIKKAMAERQLIMEVEGSLYTIPMTSIKYLHFSPCPETLPDTAFRKVKFLID